MNDAAVVVFVEILLLLLLLTKPLLHLYKHRTRASILGQTDFFDSMRFIYSFIFLARVRAYTYYQTDLVLSIEIWDDSQIRNPEAPERLLSREKDNVPENVRDTSSSVPRMFLLCSSDVRSLIPNVRTVREFPA